MNKYIYDYLSRLTEALNTKIAKSNDKMDVKLVKEIEALKKELLKEIESVSRKVDETSKKEVSIDPVALYKILDKVKGYTIKNGNWYFEDKDLGIRAEAKDGKDGINGTNGRDGIDGRDGKDGNVVDINKEINRAIKDLATKDEVDGKLKDILKEVKIEKIIETIKEDTKFIEPKIEIGKVETIQAGAEASVDVRKVDNTYKLDFYIPRGVSGRGMPGKDGLTTSVNGVEQVNGAITIDTDDIEDSATKRFVTDTEKGVWNGKANSTLDNLANVAINTSLISDTDSTDNLGSTSKYWANGYLDKLYLNSTASIDGANAGILSIVGKVGIGVVSPSVALDVNGSAYIRSTLSLNQISGYSNAYVETSTLRPVTNKGSSLGDSTKYYNAVNTNTINLNSTASLDGTNAGVIAVTGRVGIGTSVPNANAILDIDSTTKAFMPPRMTTTQRDAIPTPTEGMVIYNLTTHVLNFHNGTEWGAV